MSKINPFKLIYRDLSKENIRKLQIAVYHAQIEYLNAVFDLYYEEEKWDEEKVYDNLREYYLKVYERECAIARKRLAKKFMHELEQSLKTSHELVEDIRQHPRLSPYKME